MGEKIETPLQDALADEIDDLLYSTDLEREPTTLTANRILHKLLGDKRLIEAVAEYFHAPRQI